MNKYKYLIKNMGLLTISNFGSKILSFILIPIYTNYLTTVEYGTFDLFNTTISLLMPILTINIMSAVLRFSLDENSNKKEIFSIGLNKCLIASIIFSLCCCINYLFNFIPIFKTFCILLILLFINQSLYELLSNFSRGIEKVKHLAIAGFINSFSMLTLNIIFLVILKLKINGYFLSIVLSFILPIIYLSIALKIWKYIEFKKINKNKCKEMIKYSAPMIISNISWWVTNASDRYIVTWICGLAENGIYSLAYKLPSVLNIFQSIFNQAWTISAVKEYNKENYEFYKKIYNLYSFAMILICSILILCNKVLAKILFAKDFFQAWKYAPILMIAVVFGASCGVLEGIIQATKKTKIIAFTAFTGAFTNIVLNIIFVKSFGTIGAAIATLISYIIVLLIRLSYLKKVENLSFFNIKDFICYIILVCEVVLLYFTTYYSQIYIIEVILFVLILYINKENINKIIDKFNKKINKHI